MKYLLLIATDPASTTTDAAALEKTLNEYMAFTEALISAKEFVAGEQLTGADAATSVRVREGRPVITDGPFAETTEQLGGFYIVDVPHLDRALERAGQIPSARDGVVEVRPIVEM
jgi:hypothetical protein